MRLTYSNGAFLADADSRRDGRGIYLCRDEECISNSFKRKAWNRIARSRVDTEEIMRVVEEALNID